MIFIFTGCLAFILFYIFDLNKMKFLNKNINLCFFAGVVFFSASTVGVLLGSQKIFEVSIPLQIFFGILSISSLVLMFYSLFFALPFGKTYVEATKAGPVVDTGMYALCRHPGVIWFFLFYLFLWLASGKMMMMWAGIIWTVMDIIHVYVQDRWLFPKTLNSYDRYKLEVPFLIPNFVSIKRYISTSA